MIEIKETVKKMFNKESINDELLILKKRTNSGEFLNWADFSVLKNGDVNTPNALIEKEIITQIDKLDTFLDISCGDGSIVIAYVDLLLKNNFSKSDIAKLLHIADSKEINIMTTKERLKHKGINLPDDQSMTYTKIDEKSHSILEKKFHNVVGNPPYQNPGKTKGQKQWYRIARKCADLLEENGNLILLTPNSWMSGGQNVPTGPNGWGIARDLFTEKQLVKSKITGITDTYFKDAGMKIGIDISIWHLKNQPVTTTSKLIASDGEMDVDFRNIEFLSSIPSVISNKIVNQTFANKKLNKFEVTYFDNTIKSSDVRPIEKKKKTKKYYITHYILGSTNTDNFGVSYLDHVYKKDVSFKKILFTLQSRFWQPYLDLQGISAITQGYALSIDEGTTQEGFDSVFYSKTFTYLMKSLQIDRNGMMKRSYVDNIPKLDMSKVWTEEEIQNYLGLDQECKEHINNEIK